MSKYEIPAELVSQLAAKMESDPALQKQLNALLAIPETTVDNPAPREVSRPDGPATSKKPSFKKEDVDAAERPELDESSDMLALVPEIHLPRRVKYGHNLFVPNLYCMFQILFEMDKYIIRKFKARRAAQLLCPPFHILYFAELVCYQTLRCLSFAGYLENDDDSQFLDSLTRRYPPAIIPVPGFILPFLKAITTFIPQNKQYQRVSPSFPGQIVRSASKSWYAQNEGSQHFPLVPIIAGICSLFKTEAEKDTKPVTTFFKDNWPFGKFKTGSTTEYASDIDLNSIKLPKDTATWNIRSQSAITSPGLKNKLVYSKDLAANLADGNIDDYILPETEEFTVFKTYQEFMLMTDMTWFKSFLAPMADYANLFNGSGTLADCSVDGPPTGAYIYSYSSLPTGSKARDRPITMLDGKTVFTLAGNIRTAEKEEDPLSERMSALTHIHARLPSHHFYSANNKDNGRNGIVWDQRPIYGPTVEHEEMEAFSGSAARYVKKIYNA